MRHLTWPLICFACLAAGCATVSAPYPGEMEQRLAAFVGKERAIVFASDYQALTAWDEAERRRRGK